MVSVIKEQCVRYGLENPWHSSKYTGVYDSRVTILQRKKLSFGRVDAPDLTSEAACTILSKIIF